MPIKTPTPFAACSYFALFVIGSAVMLGITPIVAAQSEQPREERPTKESLLKLYDLADPRIDLEKLVAPGVPQDGIPPLTDPERVPVSKADYPEPMGRVIEVVINGDAVAYPLGILNFHEIANDTVGGEPIAATYCPLCDSASVISRSLDVNGEKKTLEFGVSGFLYNSNVVMYERTTDALWSQVLMQAVTGPHAGRTVHHYPVRVISFMEFKAAHPKGEVLTTNTGHERPYGRNPYQGYFDDPDRLFGDFEFTDERLPHKELGLGVVVGGRSWFVPQRAAMASPVTISTEAGDVRIGADESGMRVLEAPGSARTIQTFFHSWAAFHPQTAIVDGE